MVATHKINKLFKGRQAKMMQDVFQSKYDVKFDVFFNQVEEEPENYGSKKKAEREINNVQVILHDIALNKIKEIRYPILKLVNSICFLSIISYLEVLIPNA